MPFPRLRCAALLLVPLAQTPRSSVLVLAGGCYWGVESVFEHVRGVQSVSAGFARPSDPESDFVSAEAVRISYDPGRVSRRQLLEIFFLVAHDPTSRDRQGPDAGPQYRAIAFYQSPADQAETEGYFALLRQSGRFDRPLVTELRALGGFALVGPDQQDYAAKHPTEPYIVRNDLPKLVELKRRFPALYQEQRAP